METNIITMIKDAINDPNKITIKRAQEITGFSYTVIINAINAKRLPAVKHGNKFKIDLQDLYNWVNKKFEPKTLAFLNEQKTANNSQ